MVNGRSMEVKLIDAEGRIRQTFKPVYGCRLRYGDGDKVKRGERVADWDPFATPIVTDLAGMVKYEDLIEGVTTRDETDEATGIANKVVIDARVDVQEAVELKPCIVLTDKDGNPIKHPGGAQARYFLPVDAILSVAEGDEVQAGRHARACPDGRRDDTRHHGRSAARGGTVRSPPSEGSRDHRGDHRQGRIRPRLQEQAPRSPGAGRRRRRADRISGAEDQALDGPGRRHR